MNDIRDLRRANKACLRENDSYKHAFLGAHARELSIIISASLRCVFIIHGSVIT